MENKTFDYRAICDGWKKGTEIITSWYRTEEEARSSFDLMLGIKRIEKWDGKGFNIVILNRSF